MLDEWTAKMDALLEGISIAMTPSTTPHDLELRLIDPSKNKARLYGLTECMTLFGEVCLRIVWGRIGNRRLRERTETFESRDALERRRHELLLRRRQHGYTEVPSVPVSPMGSVAGVANEEAHAVEREIVEAHGLGLGDRTARSLVATWHAATRALRSYLAQRGADPLDMEDVSALASMYAVVAGVA
jgi:predicted DNA-binding WGR domain protein